MMESKRIEMINNSMSFDVIYKKGSIDECAAKIASEATPKTHVVGLDLMDGHPLTLLAHIDDVHVINRD